MGKEEFVRILFRPMNREVIVRRGSTLLDAAREAGIRIENICGGRGQCGKCRVILNKGETALLPEYDLRMKFISERDFSEGYRLACRTLPLSECEVTIPLESLTSHPKILAHTEISLEEVDPSSKKYLVKVPFFLDRQYLLTMLRQEIGETPTISDEVCRKLPLLERESYATATVTETGGQPEVIDVEAGDKTNRNYGLAIDLGTTTVVVYLVNLLNGEILDRASELNRQIIYGEELISRIEYGAKEEGLKKLQKAAVDCINDLIATLVSRNYLKVEEITDISISGNTVMNHLLAGINPSYLETAKTEVSRKPIVRKAIDLWIRVHAGAYAYCLPNVSRFFGGDAVADILASGMCNSEEVSLLVDLGTNGEIAFGNRDWLFSCSVASGPAFEGGGVKFGMRAMTGGIEHVKIDPATKKATYIVIGDSSPRGICGSGIIDAVAEMFLTGIIDFTGKIRDGERVPYVREGEEGLEYVVVPAEENEIGRDIVVTQKDLDYVLDSKASLCGAVATLMEKLKLSINDVRHLYLAGAFSYYTDLRNAVKIGALPEFPKAEVTPIGNGALAGAYLTLLSRIKRKEAEEIAERMSYVDLLLDTDFFREYEASLYIPGKRDLFPTLYRI
jgi:uncharacterized 2Fe-2S/4Fe-4S cluster protein (DUF4445 family)